MAAVTNPERTAVPPLDGFMSACAARGWTVTRISDRALRLAKGGSILIVGTRPGCHAEALERTRDTDDFMLRSRRP
jgi:hypothetical protein